MLDVVLVAVSLYCASLAPSGSTVAGRNPVGLERLKQE